MLKINICIFNNHYYIPVMKKIQSITICITLMMAYSITTSGQKIMKLDNELKANSKPMEANRKGVSSIGKYQFGPYKIVSGKAGWTTTESKSKFFSFETKSESRKKSSFVFVGNDKDSVLVNTSTNTKTSDTEIGDLSILNQSNNNYIALLSFTNDTTVWRMIVVTRIGEEVEGNYQAEGILTNGITEIQIREVKQWEDGKTSALKLIMGYEFFLDNNSIAAVQASLDTFQKKFVWLHQNLDERMKLVLAAASASLMVRVDDAASE
jgi:hypothetical protein